MPFHIGGIDLRTGRIQQFLFNAMFIAKDDFLFHLNHPAFLPRFMNSGIVQIISGNNIGQLSSSPFARRFRRYYPSERILQCRCIRSELVRRKQRLSFSSDSIRQLFHKRLTAFLSPISRKKRDQQSRFCVNGCPDPDLSLFVDFTTFFSTKDHNSSICASVNCKSTRICLMTVAQYSPALRIT